jgi:hypothetical protein
MDIQKILSELHADRQNLDQAIFALEHMGGRKRRGRPPKWMSQGGQEKRSSSERRRRQVEMVHRSRENESSKSAS